MGLVSMMFLQPMVLPQRLLVWRLAKENLLRRRRQTALMVRFGQERQLAKLEALTTRYGTMGIFIAAFSPIPYKVLGWMAGMGHMARKPFVVAGVLGRGLRFGFEAVLIGIYGDRALDALMWFLDNEILLGVGLLAFFAVMVLAWRWWSDLEQKPPTQESETPA